MNDIERPPKQFSALTPRLRRLLRVILFAFVLMIWNSLWLLVSTAIDVERRAVAYVDGCSGVGGSEFICLWEA